MFRKHTVMMGVMKMLKPLNCAPGGVGAVVCELQLHKAVKN